MFCNKCGAELSPNAKFCPKCGNSVKSLTPEEIEKLEAQKKAQAEKLAKERAEAEKKAKEAEERRKAEYEKQKIESEVRVQEQLRIDAEKRKRDEEERLKREEQRKKENAERSQKAKETGAKVMAFVKKFKLPIIIIIVVIIVLLVINAILSRAVSNKAHFEDEGGYKTFYDNGSVVRDELVEYKGKEYYIDGNGHMAIDSFGMVNNNGDLGFFGSKGERVYNVIKEVNDSLYYIDKSGILFKDGNFEFDGNTYRANGDGTLVTNYIEDVAGDTYVYGYDGKVNGHKGLLDTWYSSSSYKAGRYYINDDGSVAKSAWIDDYYFGEDGNMIVSAWIDDKYLGSDGRTVKNEWVGDYYLGEDGKTVKNKWVGDYYCGPDGKYIRSGYTGDGKYVGSDGKITEAPKVTQAVPATTQSANQNVGGNTSIDIVESSVATNADGAELYIIDKGTIREEYETKDGNTCKVTVIRPTIAGIDLDEGDIFNEGVGEAIDQLLEELEDWVANNSTEYKTITFTSAEMTTLTSSRARITLSGKATPRSGTSRTIKYRITYDRENETCELEKINS